MSKKNLLGTLLAMTTVFSPSSYAMRPLKPSQTKTICQQPIGLVEKQIDTYFKLVKMAPNLVVKSDSDFIEIYSMLRDNSFKVIRINNFNEQVPENFRKKVVFRPTTEDRQQGYLVLPVIIVNTTNYGKHKEIFDFFKEFSEKNRESQCDLTVFNLLVGCREYIKEPAQNLFRLAALIQNLQKTLINMMNAHFVDHLAWRYEATMNLLRDWETQINYSNFAKDITCGLSDSTGVVRGTSVSGYCLDVMLTNTVKAVKSIEPSRNARAYRHEIVNVAKETVSKNWGHFLKRLMSDIKGYIEKLAPFLPEHIQSKLNQICKLVDVDHPKFSIILDKMNHEQLCCVVQDLLLMKAQLSNVSFSQKLYLRI